MAQSCEPSDRHSYDRNIRYLEIEERTHVGYWHLAFTVKCSVFKKRQQRFGRLLTNLFPAVQNTCCISGNTVFPCNTRYFTI
eukprot:jgi/Psemu1/312353/fgenesh1_kg.932_\